MIFTDILDRIGKQLSPEFDKIIELAYNNQSHIGDLLLIKINGFYDSDFAKSNLAQKENLNPHVIGPGQMGHSEYAHYSFIHKYRTTSISKVDYSQYLTDLTWSPEKQELIDQMIDDEETTIQIEMLVYLKFWEADLIIKKLWQLVNIIQGKPYDWYFKISESARDKDGYGTRQDLIRNVIRDELKKYSPTLYDAIKKAYKTQIRNSIAHSNYSFQGRYIHPGNFIANDPASQLKSLPFDEWVEMFHITMVLYNEYIRMNNAINEHYAKIALAHNNELEIRITEKDGKQYPLYIVYRQEYDDWHYRQN